MEEADSGDSGGSAFEAQRCVVQSHSTQRIDRDVCSGDASRMEPVETLAEGDYVAGDGFLEDWAEEDRVDSVFMGTSHLFERMAGDRDDRRRAAGGGEEIAGLGGGQFISERQ